MTRPEQLIAAVWNRLPVFRVVAETQHLPTASRRLHLSASAISRTIRLLEDAVGQELFHRGGRSLTLSSAGERLLRAVEEATRSMDAGLRGLGPDPLSRPVRVSSLGVLTNSHVLPVLLALASEHPALLPVLRNQSHAERSERASRPRRARPRLLLRRARPRGAAHREDRRVHRFRLLRPRPPAVLAPEGGSGRSSRVKI